MRIYDVLPKVIVDGVPLVAYIDAPIEYPADSAKFEQLTAGLSCPLSDEQYQALLSSAPVGWKQVFEQLRGDGLI